MLNRKNTFRVFVSSTFTDMREERWILQKYVFPRLKKFCESQGAHFQDIDLRWGINEQAQYENRAMDICLSEIAKCQQLSPKPNFIILLGDKYGWQPVPRRIPSYEMKLIINQLKREDKALITSCYREDSNAIPSEYILQPWDDKHNTYDNWEKIEAKLLSILRKTINKLSLTEQQKVKYFTSATHQEILAGILRPPIVTFDPKEHIFAYIRSIENLPDDISARGYIDLSSNIRDPFAHQQLKDLKDELHSNLSIDNIYHYGAKWGADCILDDAKAFGERVYKNLKSVIETQLQEIVSIAPLDHEIQYHRDFKKKLLKYFTGRQTSLQRILNYLSSSSDKVLSIIGDSGTGKTCLIAKVIDETTASNSVKVYRFIGTTAASTDLIRLLSGIVSEIIKKYNVQKRMLLEEKENEDKFTSLQGLYEILSRCLNLATNQQPMIIILDAIDQIVHTSEAPSFDWIPERIPKNVKIVVSALPSLKNNLTYTSQYEIGAMSPTEGKLLLDKWLCSVKRTLTLKQQQIILNKFTTNGSPLYLKLVFELAKNWYSYSNITDIEDNIDGILDNYFSELEKYHSKPLVQKVCTFLLCGHYQGLREAELLDLLVFDQDYWTYFLTHCHPEHHQEVQKVGKLPIVIWSRLFLDLEHYFAEKDADGIPIISFYHRTFIDHLKNRYLPPESSSVHRLIAEYFENEPLYFDQKEHVPHTRKVVEQPIQEILAKKWKDVTHHSLGNFAFLMAKTKAGMVEGIRSNYELLWNYAPNTVSNTLVIWKFFFSEQMHVLRRGNEEWPAYKIFLQLAIEHASDSPLTISAEQWLRQGKCDWSWLRCCQQASHVRLDSFHVTFEGHSTDIKGALETRDGRFLSWSKDSPLTAFNELQFFDNTLRLWSNTGKALAVLEGHTYGVYGALETQDGNFLSWSEDNTLRLWSNTGNPLAVFEGHKKESLDGVKGALETQDGRFLSWSSDELFLWSNTDKPPFVFEKQTRGIISGALETQDGRFLSWSSDNLCFWSHAGKPLTVLEGHTDLVNGTLETQDNRFLSWSRDSTLRLWSNTGNPLAVFEGHKKESLDGVKGALEAQDGRFLSWSGDSTLRLWSNTGKPLVVFKGHTEGVSGALETQDGQFLSWSGDSTLRLWSNTGKPLAVFKGHIDWLNGALETQDGQFLSWSKDKTLRLWLNNIQLQQAQEEAHVNPLKKFFRTQTCKFLSSVLGKMFEIGSTGIKSKTIYLKKHTADICNILETQDGRFLSWSEDKTLRLWSKTGKPLAVLEGHTIGVFYALETQDGRFLSWGHYNQFFLWSTNGKPLAVLAGHSDRDHSIFYHGAFETQDGRFLSWSHNNQLRLWSTSGTPLAILKGHTSRVNGAFETQDGRILSWSWDNTLRLWSKAGKPLAVLIGHIAGELVTGVAGAIETQDGRFLSWSQDKTLRLWSKAGKPLAVLEGHTHTISGALETRDGRFLSWSIEGYGSLRLWSSNGKPIALVLSPRALLGPVQSVIETQNGSFFSWTSEYKGKDEQVQFWSAEGLKTNFSNVPYALINYPEFRFAYLGEKKCVSNVFFRNSGNDAYLTLVSKNKSISLYWSGHCDCSAKILKSDGRAILTTSSGQVCILQIYHGNQPISVKEFENMYN